MTSPPASGPEFSAPTFQACYRHPDRQTGIVCQRCKRPICGECMNPASVGFQCPQCIGRGRTETRAPRTRFGGALTNRKAPMTKIIMGIVAAVTVFGFIGLPTAPLLAMSSDVVYTGQLWRPLTWVFVSSGLFATAMNLFVLYLIGQALEAMLGSWRFLALYLLAGIGGATVQIVAQGPFLLPGTSVAIIGLLAANATVKLKQRESIGPDLGLLAILVGLGFVINGIGSAQTAVAFALVQLGAIVAGGLVGVALAFAPRAQRTLVQAVGLLGVFVLCVVVVVISTVL